MSSTEVMQAVLASTTQAPGYTFGGDDAYEKVPEVVSVYGKKVCILGGKTALSKAMPTLEPILKANDFVITDTVVYGNECVYAHAQELAKLPAVQEADVLFAVGGGKAIDCIKLVSEYANKLFFTFPTVSSTCAATSRVAAVYKPDHVFDSAHYVPRPAVHCFINSRILVEAPKHFIWAGMGDTVSKYYESNFSARGLELAFDTQMGLTMSAMSALPILTHAKAAMEAAEAKVRNVSFDQMTMSVIFSNGLTSNFLTEDFNSSIAHAMCYGFTTQKVVEEKHLHGEIVAYGILVLLTVDKQYEERAKWLKVYEEIGLPTKLADLDMTMDQMDSVFDKAMTVRDMKVSPYTVTRDMLVDAVTELEAL